MFIKTQVNTWVNTDQITVVNVEPFNDVPHCKSGWRVVARFAGGEAGGHVFVGEFLDEIYDRPGKEALLFAEEFFKKANGHV